VDGVDCVTAREAISAIIDGEPAGVSLTDLDRHLSGCAACAAWKRHAEDVSRRSRVAKLEPIPDLSGAVLARVSLPRPRTAWLRRWLPAALIVVAVVQIGIGIAQLFVPLLGHAGAGHAEPLAGFGHVERETAAFNIAVGVALLWTALGPARAVKNLLPLLLTLVILLALVTAFDLGSGEVSWIRISTHLPVLLATLTVLVLRRIHPEPRHPDVAHPGDADTPGRDRDEDLLGRSAGFGYGTQPQPPAARTRDVA
jgi:predicted anti-sigma-YlaC factor YlaD